MCTLAAGLSAQTTVTVDAIVEAAATQESVRTFYNKHYDIVIQLVYLSSKVFLNM